MPFEKITEKMMVAIPADFFINRLQEKVKTQQLLYFHFAVIRTCDLVAQVRHK